MENYQKGKNVEEPLEREKIPIPNLPSNFLWMHVLGGTKIRNVLTHALKEFPEQRSVVWTGFGPSVGKTITCAEIMKREYRNTLHQITKICYRLVEEFWDPLIPELDQLVVRRKLPMIHIYLSLEPLDRNELGYQAPGTRIAYEKNNNRSRYMNDKRKHKVNKTPTKEFASMHVDRNKRCKEDASNKVKKCDK